MNSDILHRNLNSAVFLIRHESFKQNKKRNYYINDLV